MATNDFKSEWEATMSDYRRSYEEWKKIWKVGEYTVKKESSQQQKAIEAMCNKVKITCDVVCIMSENTCEAKRYEFVVCDQIVDDGYIVDSELGNTLGNAFEGFESVEHIEFVLNEVPNVNLVGNFIGTTIGVVNESKNTAIAMGYALKTCHSLALLILANFNHSFPRDSFLFQDHCPIVFIITIYDPGLDSRTNLF